MQDLVSCGFDEPGRPDLLAVRARPGASGGGGGGNPGPDSGGHEADRSPGVHAGPQVSGTQAFKCYVTAVSHPSKPRGPQTAYLT